MADEREFRVYSAIIRWLNQPDDPVPGISS